MIIYRQNILVVNEDSWFLLYIHEIYETLMQLGIVGIWNTWGGYYM